MDTTYSVKTTNKNAIIGGILCIVTAVIMGCFGIGSMIMSIIGTLTYIFNVARRLIEAFFSYGDIVYLLSIINDLLRYLVSFCAQITGGVSTILILVMGIVLLIKKNGKGIIIFPIAQIALGLLNVLMTVAGFVIVLIIALLNGNKIRLIDMLLNSYTAGTVGNLISLLCWAAFTVVVLLILKRKIPTGGSATVAALATAALMAFSRLYSIVTMLWSVFPTGYYLWMDGHDIYFILSAMRSSLWSLAGSAISSVIMAVLFAVTFFFAVKGISNAYIQKEN